MSNQVIHGLLDIKAPGSGNPFSVLTINADTFHNAANRAQSYYIVARDIDASPPDGAITFSVGGDGLVNTKDINANGTVGITAPYSDVPASVLTINTSSFANPDNALQSYFIVATDLAAPKVMFSVRGDGFITAGGIDCPTITALQEQLESLQTQVFTLTNVVKELTSIF